MKYVKSGTFTTKQLSISETITETRDVIAIAQNLIKDVSGVTADVKQRLSLISQNLDQATHYLNSIERKADIALKHVPADVQEKEFL